MNLNESAKWRGQWWSPKRAEENSGVSTWSLNSTNRRSKVSKTYSWELLITSSKKKRQHYNKTRTNRKNKHWIEGLVMLKWIEMDLLLHLLLCLVQGDISQESQCWGQYISDRTSLFWLTSAALKLMTLMVQVQSGHWDENIVAQILQCQPAWERPVCNLTSNCDVSCNATKSFLC